MAEVRCPICAAAPARSGGRPSPTIVVRCTREGDLHGDSVKLEGITTCLEDGHRRPITIINDAIDETSPQLPVEESSRLERTLIAILYDIEEAEHAYFAQCYKAGSVMCRRAIELTLEFKRVPDCAGLVIPTGLAVGADNQA